MDLPALSCGLLHSGVRPGATGAELGGDLRELLFFDEEMLWVEDDAQPLPPGQSPRSAAAEAQGGTYAPAGLRESALPLPGLLEEQPAAECADGGQARVCSHPLWPVLVDYYFACRKVGATDSATIRAINSERAELAQRVQELNAAAGRAPYVMGTDPELDAFLRAYVKELEVLKAELEQILSTTDDICASFEKRLKAIVPSAGGSGGTGRGPAGSALAACAVAQAQTGSLILAATGEAQPGGLGREAEELLRQHLKRRHAASILSLKEEFMRKRKKGKLPKDATTALKTWWASNLVWPYPSDDDKRTLGDETCLNATQINNWFINQRKRHWHKLFLDGPPSSAEEAHRGLVRAYGSLDAALAAAQRA